MSSPSRETAKKKPKAEPSEESQTNSMPSTLDDHVLFINRELSLIEFQRRVLEEARDERNPLLERVKFLAIVYSNVSEMFMVRVAGLKQQVEAGIADVAADGMTPKAQLEAIRAGVRHLTDDALHCFHHDLLPALAEEGIRILDYSALTEKYRESVDEYFQEIIYPVLTPLAFDPGRPFPHISNLSLNLAVLIRDQGGVERFARVKVPDTLPRLVSVHRTKRTSNGSTKHREQPFVWIEQLIQANLGALFPGMEILEAHPFHVTRDADIAIQELEADDLLETIEEGVRARRFGSVVRLSVNKDMPEHMLEILVENLEMNANDVYPVHGPLALDKLMQVYKLDREDLKDIPFPAALPPCIDPAKTDEDDIFAAIRRENILMHHPYDTFQPVVDFLTKASKDPDVLAIKMTLYRVGRNTPIVDILLDANEKGKQVAVLVELKARFDEESNIEWAKALEREGVHVVYGLVGLKIHSKITLVVRREGDRIRRYMHLSTGNYNVVTSHLYTDLGFFTCDEQIGADATDLFNYLTGYSAKKDFSRLLVAPINLRQRLRSLIEREIEVQQQTGEGRLILKCNALIDKEMIQLLYRASQAGVKIDLLVRGICCLKPGLPGISDNIKVTSIVGRFLEHSRIYYFRNGGNEEIYLGSADLMPRNIDRRVETLFPIENPKMIRHLRDDILGLYLADNVKARHMQSDGTYVQAERGKNEPPVDCQATFIARSIEKRKGE